MTKISGVVLYRARIALPSGAVVQVRLEDTARQDAAATVVAETEVVTNGEQAPIPFALDADLSANDERARLALRATIEVEGRLRFATTSHIPLPPGQPDGIEVFVEQVAASAPPLGETEWMLVELDGEAVHVTDGERAPTLVLDVEESRVAGSGGVNRLMGSFVLSAAQLRFGPLATTLMAGPEPAMARERSFLDALARVTTYELEDRTLTLLAGDGVVARLSC